MLRYVGKAALSGVIGWAALIGMFEVAYWGDAYLQQWKRGRSVKG